MSPDVIYQTIKQVFPELTATKRKSPDGWSFWLGEKRTGLNSNRIFHYNRASAGAKTMIRLPVTKRIKGERGSYFEFEGSEVELVQMVKNELRLYLDNFA